MPNLKKLIEQMGCGTDGLKRKKKPSGPFSTDPAVGIKVNDTSDTPTDAGIHTEAGTSAEGGPAHAPSARPFHVIHDRIKSDQQAVTEADRLQATKDATKERVVAAKKRITALEKDLKAAYDKVVSTEAKVMFPNLEKMIIYDMGKLNTIWGTQQRLATNSSGRLKYIEIRNCPGLISIFPSYVMIQSLKYIVVEGCGGLKYLLPATVAKQLSKLGSLRIERCPMMEVLIIDDNSNQSSIDEILFPNLEELIIIDMDKLNTICHWFHLLPPTSFGKLRTLEISNCPEFIFPSQLQSLEELRITNCKYLEQISGDTLVATSISLSNSKLMELCVAGCHSLPFLFSSSSAKSLDNGKDNKI
ncbi:hypothetical protein L6164_001203 [Bauhinia variegata]|uniref:Uncharacterized protein n=1 Tax=Bauhinia variegata TaxID=167791 RepID=A0ACB9QBJ6_BAUVA|nr:hypothetical protein L6164_001203 [Bauhinia variegata]